MLLGVAGLVLASASPASAANLVTAGAGTGAGFEIQPSAATDCSTGLPPVLTAGTAFNSDTFVLDHASNYDSVDTSTTVAAYVGGARMTIKTGPVVQAPQGAAPGNCSGVALGLVAIPSPVGITDVTIDSASDTLTGVVPDTGSVTCTMPVDNGFYLRVNTSVVFDFTVTCNITSPVGSVSGVSVHHHVVGNQVPCVQSVPPFSPFAGQGCAPLPVPADAVSIMQTSFAADSVTPPLPI